jgi:hypothetical protein
LKIRERGDVKKENIEHNLGFALRLKEGIGVEFKPMNSCDQSNISSIGDLCLFAFNYMNLC